MPHEILFSIVAQLKNYAVSFTYLHFNNIAKIRHILSQKDAEKLVHAFVTSRLDYCNSLLSGCPNKSLKTLQLVQNAAARVLTKTRKRDHISPILALLHWLPVKSRIEFKILLLTYKALNGLAPSYLIVPYYPTRALCSQNAYMWFLKSPKVEWEAEPSAIKLLSCGTIFQFRSWWQTLSLCLRVGLKISFLTRLIVRSSQAHLGPAPVGQ